MPGFCPEFAGGLAPPAQRQSSMASTQTPQPTPRFPLVQRLGGLLSARRTKRAAFVIVVLLVVVGLLGFFAAPPLIRHFAEQQLSRQLERPTTIARIALNPYTLRLEADGIQIGERGGNGPFVAIARLVVRPSWTSLLRGAPIVDEVRIDSPQLHLIRYDAQRFNFTDLIEKFSKPSAAPSSGPVRFSVANIRIENGRIDFDDRLLKVTHTIDQWALGVPFVATLASKTDIFVQPALRLRFDGSPIAIDGKTKPFAQTRESELNLKFDGLDIPKLLSYAPARLPVAVSSGKLSSDLALRFAMDGTTPTLRVSGTVDLADANVTDTASRPLFAARGVHLAAASLEPLRAVWHLDTLRLDQPVVTLTRDGAGLLNVQKLAAASAGAPAASAPASASSASSAATASAASAGKPAHGAPSATSPATPLDLSVRHVAIEDGTVRVSDASVAPAANLTLTHLNKRVDGFTLRGRQPARFWVSSALEQGGALKLAGAFSLAQHQAGVHVALDGLALPALAPYLAGVSSARWLDGRLGVTLDAFADWSKAPLVANVGPSTADIAGIDVDGLAVDVARRQNGEIDLASLAAPAPASPASSEAARASGPWHYRIGALNLNSASANVTDLSTPRPVKLALSALQLKLGPLTDDLSKPLPLTVRNTLNRRGSLAVTGEVSPQPLDAKLRIDANRLDAAAFEPYFGSALNATIASALLNAKGQMAVSQTKSAMRAAYRGGLALVDVRLLDKATSDPFAGWRSLAAPIWTRRA
ncbi:MAG: hypothetical protein GAK40_00391 [Burkholderia plantarii]|nr:MAG: hypothetical protein GAK40_00391 [Burkholderia plantarii]